MSLSLSATVCRTYDGKKRIRWLPSCPTTTLDQFDHFVLHCDDYIVLNRTDPMIFLTSLDAVKMPMYRAFEVGEDHLENLT